MKRFARLGLGAKELHVLPDVRSHDLHEAVEQIVTAGHEIGRRLPKPGGLCDVGYVAADRSGDMSLHVRSKELVYKLVPDQFFAALREHTTLCFARQRKTMDGTIAPRSLKVFVKKPG